MEKSPFIKGFTPIDLVSSVWYTYFYIATHFVVYTCVKNKLVRSLFVALISAGFGAAETNDFNTHLIMQYAESRNNKVGILYVVANVAVRLICIVPVAIFCDSDLMEPISVRTPDIEFIRFVMIAYGVIFTVNRYVVKKGRLFNMSCVAIAAFIIEYYFNLLPPTATVYMLAFTSATTNPGPILKLGGFLLFISILIYASTVCSMVYTGIYKGPVITMILGPDATADEIGVEHEKND
jgi:hypothetical protein